MPLSAVALASRALIKLGAEPIASFGDGTAEAEIAGALYGPARDALLSSYPWSFATGQAALARLGAEPVADFAHAFAMPVDCLRVLSAGAGGRGRGLDYRIARNAIHTSSEAVVLTYIFRPDESQFPPFFDGALIARLAAELCVPVTENTNRAEMLYRVADLEERRARLIDAQQDTPARIDDFALIEARS